MFYNRNYYTIIILLVPILGLDYLCESAAIDYNNPVVATSYGQVKGKPYTYSSQSGTVQPSKQVVAFIGVPYARPPTGTDRFMPPGPPDSWANGPLDCTNTRVMCPQVVQRFNYQPPPQPINENENCLYLNIYVPVSNYPVNQQMPVLVYFHGGEFKYGGKDFVKPDYLLDNSMIGNNPALIVVTVNYRLGIFGFLSTDDISQPGNNGIRDQVQALRWISENIGAFNGDPGRVTIMGHDAGAISVSMHVLNQESWPYFHNAISIGGTVFTPWAFEDNPKQQAQDFGGFFGCDLQSNKLVDCLRNKDLDSMLGISRNRDQINNIERFWFRPVVDRNTSSAMLKDYPLALYQTAQFNKVPYLIGVTKDEGSLEYYLQYDRVKDRNTVEEKIAYLIRPFMREYASEDIIASAMKYQYFSRNQSRSALTGQFSNSAPNTRLSSGIVTNNLNNVPGKYQSLNAQAYQSGGADAEQSRLLIEMLSDFLYVAPSDYVARLHSQNGGHVWFYVFQYKGSKSFGPLQANAFGQSYGVSHMDDLFYLFPTEYIQDPPGLINDVPVINVYARIVTYLAANGRMQGYNWHEYTPYNPNYLIFSNNPTITTGVPVNRPSDGYRTINSDFFNGFIYELQFKTTRYPLPFPISDLKAYRAATWSLFGFIVLLVIVLVAIIAVLCIKTKKKNELKLLRKNDRELEERFNTT